MEKYKRKIFDIKMFFYDLVQVTTFIPSTVFFRMKNLYECGKKPKDFFDGDYIIASNHATNMDPMILSYSCWFRRIRYIATSFMFKKNLLGLILRMARCIPVDKENVSMKTFKDVKNAFKEKHSVCVFPEGEVAHDGVLKVYKQGAVMMAVSAGVQILPVCILKRKNIFQRQRVVYGNKISISDYCEGPFPTMDEIEKITQILMEKEKELKLIGMKDAGMGESNG